MINTRAPDGANKTKSHVKQNTINFVDGVTIQKKAKIELKDRDMVQITGRSCCHALTKGLEHLLNCSLHTACLKHSGGAS